MNPVTAAERQSYVNLVKDSPDLPDWAASLRRASPVSDTASAATLTVDVDRVEVTDDYLKFLDQQVALAARGPAWTATLGRRRAALAPHSGRILARVGLSRTSDSGITEVACWYFDLTSKGIVHSETD
jgi:hypothetical protein